MAAIPTIEEEDGRRPHRERESLVAERTRIINRMKGCLARLGIRGYKPNLQRATKLLPALRTPEGTPLPPNALAEMGRDLARLHFVEGQIREIEAARLERLHQDPTEKSHSMVRLLTRIIGVGVETADMLVREVPVTQFARSTRGGALCRINRGTGRERFETPGEGTCSGRQRPSAARHDPTGMALSDVPEGKRSRAMVPLSHCRCTSRRAEIIDRRHGP